MRAASLQKNDNGNNEEDWKTKEILDRRGIYEDGPGGVQQSGTGDRILWRRMTTDVPSR